MLRGASTTTTSAAMLSCQVVRTLPPSFLLVVPTSNLPGVATNIQNSVNMDCFDKDGFGSFLYVPLSTLFNRMLLMVE
jgi:hypothetical protein